MCDRNQFQFFFYIIYFYTWDFNLLLAFNYNNTSLDKLKEKIHGVGFEPTRPKPADLKSAPLDHSGIRACLFNLSWPNIFRFLLYSSTATASIHSCSCCSSFSLRFAMSASSCLTVSSTLADRCRACRRTQGGDCDSVFSANST